MDFVQLCPLLHGSEYMGHRFLIFLSFDNLIQHVGSHNIDAYLFLIRWLPVCLCAHICSIRLFSPADKSQVTEFVGGFNYRATKLSGYSNLNHVIFKNCNPD